MTKSPIFWGAGLACALGGAIAGTALGSTPMINRPSIGSYYRDAELEPFRGAAERPVLPDHYPLVTRQGTVPVAALSSRGLYRQARYQAYYAPVGYEPVQYTSASYEPVGEKVRAAPHDASLAIGDPPIERQATPRANVAVEVPAPLDFSNGPASVSRGHAKMIDVKTTLAMQ